MLIILKAFYKLITSYSLDRGDFNIIIEIYFTIIIEISVLQQQQQQMELDSWGPHFVVTYETRKVVLMTGCD